MVADEAGATTTALLELTAGLGVVCAADDLADADGFWVAEDWAAGGADVGGVDVVPVLATVELGAAGAAACELFDVGEGTAVEVEAADEEEDELGVTGTMVWAVFVPLPQAASETAAAKATGNNDFFISDSLIRPYCTLDGGKAARVP